MSYENPQVRHEVNVSRESVLVEFLRLAIGLALAVLAAAAVLYVSGGALARFIPYSAEQRWVGDRVLAPDRRSRRMLPTPRAVRALPAAPRRGPGGDDAACPPT